jgi:hypothetical protein
MKLDFDVATKNSDRKDGKTFEEDLKPFRFLPRILAYITVLLICGMALIGGCALLAGISFILSYPVMLLWNGCLVPAVSGVHYISWLQAWGLTILITWLFKSSNTTTKNTEQKGK